MLSYFSLAYPLPLFLLLLAGFANSENATLTPSHPCYQGSPLPMSLIPGGHGNYCDGGFYCPNLNSSNPATYATICPPTTDCQIQRLRLKFCDAQGLYDPILCPAGFYCPTYLEKYECPSGSICPAGRQFPIQCAPLSLCPAGSTQRLYLGGFVWILSVDLALALGLFLYRKYEVRKNEERTRRYMGMEGLSMTKPTHEFVDLNMTKLPKYTQSLCRGFERARTDYMISELDTGKLANMSEEERKLHRYMQFEFKNLSLTIPSKDSKSKGKCILAGVTGTIKPGSVTAIMGPSGAGKTTFLNTMMGKVDSSWERGGELKINDQNAALSQFKTVVGYVPQDDVMHRELTVYENIKYAAELRLPRSWTSRQREQHVQAVISAMQLSHVHDSLIGDETERGVSGGQRKRVNIGMELAAAPLSLFLDEPTSGLDSTSALEVCKVLKDIARTTRITVAMVIHQPRVEIWQSLDQILLLAPGGKTVYQGPQKLCQSYFMKHLALKLHPQENPADAIMDAIALEGDTYVKVWSTDGIQFLEKLMSAWKENGTGVRAPLQSPTIDGGDDDSQRQEKHGGQVVEMHELSDKQQENAIPQDEGGADGVSSEWKAGNNNKVEVSASKEHAVKFHFESDEKAEENEDGDGDNDDEDAAADDDYLSQPLPQLLSDGRSHARGASFLKQIWITHNRSLHQQKSKLSSLVIEIIVGLAAGLIMGISATAEYQGILKGPYALISPSAAEWTIPQTGMFVCMSISLAAASAGVRVFGEEQVIYWREAATGLNRLSYFIGANLANVYRQFLDALHFTFIYHILSRSYLPFEHFLAMVFLQFFGTYGLAAIISQLTTRENQALVAVVVALIMSVFNGYANNLPNFLKFLTPGYWMTEAFFSEQTAPYENVMQVSEISAEIWGYHLHAYSMDLALMFAIGVAYRAIAFVFMIFRHQDKQR